MDGQNTLGLDDVTSKRIHSYSMTGGLYGDLPPASHENQLPGVPGSAATQGVLPLPFPNPAPEVNLAPEASHPPVILNPTPVTVPYLPETHNEPRKKKYAKEAWPGKKPTPSLLIWPMSETWCLLGHLLIRPQPWSCSNGVCHLLDVLCQDINYNVRQKIFSSSRHLYMQLTWWAHTCSQSGSEICYQWQTAHIGCHHPFYFFFCLQCVRYIDFFFLLNMFYGYTTVYWWFMYIHICIRGFCVNFCQNTGLLLFLQKLKRQLFFQEHHCVLFQEDCIFELLACQCLKAICLFIFKMVLKYWCKHFWFKTPAPRQVLINIYSKFIGHFENMI